MGQISIWDGGTVSGWELLGWALAIPMAIFSGLFVIAFTVGTVRAIANRKKLKPSTVSKPRLYVVKDD
jgi:hypothetical protein